MEKIKRHRRTKAEMAATKAPIEVVEKSSDNFLERHRKVEKRGRPKVEGEETEKPKVYDITFTDGSVWHYDWNKNPSNGLVNTNTVYPKDFDFTLPDDDALPITKRQWLNPANGKYVGYGRAVQLGLYKPENEGKGKRGRPKAKI